MPDRDDNPFNNPDNEVKSWTNETTHQYNQKIIKGPDEGVHRFADQQRNRCGQTGTVRPGK